MSPKKTGNLRQAILEYLKSQETGVGFKPDIELNLETVRLIEDFSLTVKKHLAILEWLQESKEITEEQLKEKLEQQEIYQELNNEGFHAKRSTNGLVDIHMNYLKLRFAEEDFTGRLTRPLYDRRGNQTGELKLITNNEQHPFFENEMIMDDLRKGLRASQIQLMDFIEYKLTETDAGVNIAVKIDVDEYFELRGIARRKENVDRLIEDVRMLSCLWLDVECDLQGKPKKIRGPYLTIRGYKYAGAGIDDKEAIMKKKVKKLEYIGVAIGMWWEECTAVDQYSLMPKTYWQLNPHHDHSAILLASKMGQMIRASYTKLKKSDQSFSINIKYALDMMGYDVDRIGNNQYKSMPYFVEMFENSMDKLDKLGFKWQFSFEGMPKNKTEFLKGDIIFSNPDLVGAYLKVRNRRKRKRKQAQQA